MMVRAGASDPRVGPAVDAALNLNAGGICLIVGAVSSYMAPASRRYPGPRTPKRR